MPSPLVVKEIEYISKHPLYPVLVNLEETLEVLNIPDLDPDLLCKHAQQVTQLSRIVKQYCFACMVFRPAPGSVESSLMKKLLSCGFQCLLAIDLHRLVRGTQLIEIQDWSSSSVTESAPVSPISEDVAMFAYKSTLNLIEPSCSPIDVLDAASYGDATEALANATSEVVVPDSPETLKSDGDEYITESSSESDFVKKRPRTKKEPKNRPNYSRQVTEILKGWLFENSLDPYPDEDSKRKLCKATGLNWTQLNNWFINGRRRYLQPGSYLKRKS